MTAPAIAETPRATWPVRPLPANGELQVRVLFSDLVRERNGVELRFRLKCELVETGERQAYFFDDWPTTQRALETNGVLDPARVPDIRPDVWLTSDRVEVPLKTRHVTIITRERRNVRSIEFRPLDPRLALEARYRRPADELAAAVEVTAAALAPVFKRHEIELSAADVITGARMVLARQGED